MTRRIMHPDWKTHVFALNALLFALLGFFLLATHWEGISVWWSFTSRPHGEGPDSPIEGIRGSEKVVPGMLFLFGGVLNALHWLHLTRRGR